MAGTHDPREGETPPSETRQVAEYNEAEWSPWERQKLEVYRREHPDTQPAESTSEEGGVPT
jgi:hypothetical protein